MDEHVCVGEAAATVVGAEAEVVSAGAGAGAAAVVGAGVFAAETHCEALAWYKLLFEQQYTEGS